MKTVLRLALGYSSMIPLQSWLTLLGVILLAVALVLGVVARTPESIVTMTVFGILGAAMVAFVPALMGGAALRSASTRTTLHLRPHGRLRMLAAATLAITALAALLSLSVLVAQLVSHLHGFTEYSRTFHPGLTFVTAWSSIAVLWIVVFAMSGSRVLSVVVPFAIFLGPTVLMKTGKSSIYMQGPLFSLAAALAAWLLFALWYLRARSFRTPRWFGFRLNQNFEGTLPGMVASLLEYSRRGMSPQRASSRLLLGVMSPLRYALMTTAACVAFFVFFSLVSSGKGRVPPFDLMLAFGAMCGAQVAYLATCRARMLWLRTGSDRASLFAMVERNGLLATLWLLAMLASLAVAWLLLRKPELAAPTLLFAALQVPGWAAGFYLGMSVTRNWNVEEVLLCIAVAALIMTGAAAIQPERDASLLIHAAVFSLSVVLAALLRNLARRRWRAVDWRIARLPTKAERASGRIGAS